MANKKSVIDSAEINGIAHTFDMWYNDIARTCVSVWRGGQYDTSTGCRKLDAKIQEVLN